MKTQQVKKIKTVTAGNTTIKVLKQQPRKRVEPNEWYRAELVAADIKDSTLGEAGDKFLQLDFKLLAHEDNVCEDGKTSASGLQISGMFGLPPRVGNKTHKILSAIIGHELEQNEEVNVKAHLGKKFKAFIKDKQTMDDSGQHWQKVDLVKSLKKVVD